MRTITTLDELDALIAECDSAASDEELRRLFMSFKMRQPEISGDPFSDSYAQSQLEYYASIAGKSYAIENESYQFDVDSLVKNPFPYYTGNTVTVGNQLLSVGSLIRVMKVPPGGRILEFGPGWGNTTLALAQAGFDVTAVDIEERYCRLLHARAEQISVSINVVNADFMWAETVEEPYDAVVFFECFHHCVDHLRLLRALHKAVKPGGHIYFGGEPIEKDFPMPWGVRLGGEALWAIRKYGWLELGFNEEYFRHALLSTGWEGTKHESIVHAAANVWEARRFDSRNLWTPANNLMIGSTVGQKESQSIRVSNATNGWGFFGPYCALPAGRWIARANLSRNVSPRGDATIDVCVSKEARTIASVRSDLTHHASDVIDMPFELQRPESDIQMRLFCHNNVSFELLSIDFLPQESE
ncbi:2-polyprenyl-3-methyl-5-hydroxy-6-metoxy-1,4-benzoquinol methylase [Paraburkholderia sp. GAS448]|uniref:class I SAM-dependent methyltransferase n=1 Tax=Paraburkholderia sp. GAS448 TaxID=3035136 RepID=UPI003D1DB6D7